MEHYDSRSVHVKTEAQSKLPHNANRDVTEYKEACLLVVKVLQPMQRRHKLSL